MLEWGGTHLVARERVVRCQIFRFSYNVEVRQRRFDHEEVRAFFDIANLTLSEQRWSVQGHDIGDGSREPYDCSARKSTCRRGQLVAFSVPKVWHRSGSFPGGCPGDSAMDREC